MLHPWLWLDSDPPKCDDCVFLVQFCFDYKSSILIVENLENMERCKKENVSNHPDVTC